MKKEHVFASTITTAIILIVFLLMSVETWASIPLDIKILAIVPITFLSVIFSEWNFSPANSKPPLML